jgi:hypothetical protein
MTDQIPTVTLNNKIPAEQTEQAVSDALSSGYRLLWSTIGGVLPPGASVDLARSALFFDGARIAGPILVLVVWAALGTLLALALGGRLMDPVDVKAEAAAGAAG